MEDCSCVCLHEYQLCTKNNDIAYYGKDNINNSPNNCFLASYYVLSAALGMETEVKPEIVLVIFFFKSNVLNTKLLYERNQPEKIHMQMALSSSVELMFLRYSFQGFGCRRDTEKEEEVVRVEERAWEPVIT